MVVKEFIISSRQFIKRLWDSSNSGIPESANKLIALSILCGASANATITIQVKVIFSKLIRYF